MISYMKLQVLHLRFFLDASKSLERFYRHCQMDIIMYPWQVYCASVTLTFLHGETLGLSELEAGNYMYLKQNRT